MLRKRQHASRRGLKTEPKVSLAMLYFSRLSKQASSLIWARIWVSPLLN